MTRFRRASLYTQFLFCTSLPGVRRSLLIFTAVCFSLATVSGQHKRPKVGLVLSGGGARGIAHIGVIKALEEAGLKPDYITGTSMGSIVGGLYAAGYSADQLREIVESVEWDQLLSNKIPMNTVAFEEKPYYGRYLLNFYYENKHTVFPKGIIEGQALMQFFSDHTLPVQDISDFSKLPIPFACVASDIVTGEPVVLNKGSLALSMRASMSIPSIFTPVRIDNHLLVDGGLLRNMPVQEVLDMGADIVIGVFVSTDLEPEENLTSPLAIISQSAFISSAFDTRKQLARCDVLIQPDITGISTGSFEQCPIILERGTQAGNAYREKFEKLADSLDRLGPAHPVVQPVIAKEYRFDEVDIVGSGLREFILGKLALDKNKPVRITELDKKIQLLYGTQYFEKLWYEIQSGNGTQRLVLHVRERLRDQFRFSYHYDWENKGGVVGNVTLRNRLFNKSRLVAEADLSTFPRFTLDYFKYLGRRQTVAVQALGALNKNELPSYDSLGNLESLFGSTSMKGTIRLQTARFISGAVGVEATWSRLVLKPRIADASVRSLSKLNYNHTTLAVYHRFDNTDDRYFPTRGLRSEIKLSTTTQVNGSATLGDSLELPLESLGDLLYTKSINTFVITLAPFVSLSKKISLLAKARLRLSSLPDNKLNLDNYDFLGGFTPNLDNGNEYYGGSIKEFQAANYFYGRMGLQYRVKRHLYLQGHLNYLDTKDLVQKFYKDVDPARLGDRFNRWGYSLYAGYSSPIGPIAFAVAKDHHRDTWKATLWIGFQL